MPCISEAVVLKEKEHRNIVRLSSESDGAPTSYLSMTVEHVGVGRRGLSLLFGVQRL